MKTNPAVQLNGLLLIDKPAGCTSHDVVAKIRKILHTKSVGHCGTLDPIASGLLVILLGHGTKLSDYLLSQDKRYWVRVKLGVTTDTGDRSGQVLQEKPVNVTAADVRQAAESILGEMELPVPIFSAVKIKGKKLYEYARQNEVIAVPQKAMKFYDMDFMGLMGTEADIEISCSKGSYVRAWVTLLGEKLGVGATVGELRRVASLPYSLHEALTLEKLEEIVKSEGFNPEQLGSAYVTMANSLPGWMSCMIKGREERLLRNGQISQDLLNRLILTQKDANRLQKSLGVKVVNEVGDLVGLLEAMPMAGLKIRRVFNQLGA